MRRFFSEDFEESLDVNGFDKSKCGLARSIL